MGRTKVHNRTKAEFVVFDVTGWSSRRRVGEILPGRIFTLEVDPNATYKECLVVFEPASKTYVLSTDDIEEWRSIELVPSEDDPTKVVWEGITPQKWMGITPQKWITPRLSPESQASRNAREDASKKIEAFASFSVDLEKDLKRVVIYRAQCAHLVQFCSVRVQKIKRIFSLVSDNQMRRLYESKKLRQLAISLDNLLCALLSAQMLLKGCGKKEWRRAALVLSLPPPDPQLEKYSGSKFVLVIRELGWSFDMVQYALGKDGTTDMIFNWDDGRDRYVLQGNQLENGVAIGEMELLQGDRDRETLDRQQLLRDLENSSILKDNFFIFLAGWLWYNIPHGKIAATIQNRCQNQCQTQNFDIDYLDLRKTKRISKGGFKKVHKGEWMGLEVAIATIWNTPREAVEREAGFMVTVHHPNVVDFFGCAFKKEEGGATQEDQWTAFLVMELMEEDLGRLIARITRDPLAARRSDSGGPFSLFVTVDILIQIVEAMIHSHKHKVMHRDLKTGNCLVSKKSAPQSDEDAHYRVKVIDFGLSKLWDSERDIHTAKQGTVRYMAPEVWDGGDYTWSADVYSFGMVCYEVITGSPPLTSTPFDPFSRTKDLFDLLRGGERPLIPGTCPESLSILMKKCWAATPEDRPTFKAIRKDLWGFRLLIEAQIQVQP